MPLELKQKRSRARNNKRERERLEEVFIKEEPIMREEQEQCGTPLNILLTLKSFTAQRYESSATVGQKVEIGRKKHFKGIYSETVRCRSRSALKISHLRSTTACFNPRSLSENSKWCSKPFHHCRTNHMLPFIRDFLLPFCTWPTDKSNSESLNCPGFFCALHAGQGFQLGLVRVSYL